MSEQRPVRVLENATRLVDALVEHGPGSVAELSELVQLPRATAHRLIGALQEVDLVRPLPDGRVALSLRWLHLADAAARVHVGAEVHQVLARLAHLTGQTVYLSVPRGTSSVCLDWAQGRGIELLILRPGRHLPLYAGAAGRATLAGLADEEVSAYLAQAPFPAFTPQTLTTAEALASDVSWVRERGYALSDEDVTPAIGAVGVPIPGQGGRLQATISVAGAAVEIRQHLDDYVELLRAAAGEITLD